MQANTDGSHSVMMQMTLNYLIMEFRTHTGEIIKGERLKRALIAVGNDWEQSGYDIRKENAYASHVTDNVKEQNLQDHIRRAKEIKSGLIGSFTVWQRVNEKLTGECVALLPK